MALPAVLISSIISIILVPLVLRISHRKGWYDTTDERKIHTGDIPRLGGVAIFAGLVLGVTVVVLRERLSGGSGLPVENLLLCGAGVTIVFAIGLIDDFRNIPAFWKAAGQVVAALLAVSAGCLIREIYVPFLWRTVPLGAFAYPLTVLWLVGMSNAVNLIDGMDGLAGGVSAIAAATFAVVGIIEGNAILTLFALALFGGAVGFLAFNLPPASIFMGDSGSLLLGFVLALLPLLPFTTGGAGMSILQPVTILFIPILDTTAAIVRRLLRGEPIHAPDREHLHHKLLDLGLSTRQALAAIYGTAIVLGGIGVLYEAISPVAAVAVFVVVCAAGTVSMKVLASKHAEIIAMSRVEFMPDNISYHEPSVRERGEAERAVR